MLLVVLIVSKFNVKYDFCDDHDVDYDGDYDDNADNGDVTNDDYRCGIVGCTEVECWL